MLAWEPDKNKKGKKLPESQRGWIGILPYEEVTILDRGKIILDSELFENDLY